MRKNLLNEIWNYLRMGFLHTMGENYFPKITSSIIIWKYLFLSIKEGEI